MKTIKINVTKKHIQKGQRDSPSSCPIALAIRSKMDIHVIIDFDTARFYDHEEIRLPRIAKNFIRKFDSGKPVKPFSFDMIYEDIKN